VKFCRYIMKKGGVPLALSEMIRVEYAVEVAGKTGGILYLIKPVRLVAQYADLKAVRSKPVYLGEYIRSQDEARDNLPSKAHVSALNARGAPDRIPVCALRRMACHVSGLIDEIAGNNKEPFRIESVHGPYGAQALLEALFGNDTSEIEYDRRDHENSFPDEPAFSRVRKPPGVSAKSRFQGFDKALRLL